MKRGILLVTAILSLFVASVADAAIKIDIGDASIAADSTGFVDVTMTVDTDTRLSFYSLHFGVDSSSPHPNPDSELPFSEYTLGYHSESLPHPYVFLGTSGNLAGDVPGSPTEGLEWKVGDFADPDLYVDLHTGTTYLLARLKFQHHTLTSGFDPTGNVFAVSLISDFDTQFLDEFWDPENPIPYTRDPSDPGEVTITGGSAVIPEPGSLLIFAGLVMCAAPFLRRRRAR